MCVTSTKLLALPAGSHRYLPLNGHGLVCGDTVPYDTGSGAIYLTAV